jgi:hypothetical protein
MSSAIDFAAFFSRPHSIVLFRPELLAEIRSDKLWSRKYW